jgi:hypothetical protein
VIPIEDANNGFSVSEHGRRRKGVKRGMTAATNFSVGAAL